MQRRSIGDSLPQPAPGLQRPPAQAPDKPPNASERAIRRDVIRRKLCFGTHSEACSRFAERMLTLTLTLRQKGRGVVDSVMRSIEASLRGEHPQSLLPMTASKIA